MFSERCHMVRPLNQERVSKIDTYLYTISSKKKPPVVHAKKITKEDCLVDFSKDAKTVHNQIRGLSPFPLSFTHTPNGKLLKLIESTVADSTTPHECVGEILSLDGCIEIACAIGSVYIERVLPEGKARMSAADFIRGRNISVGDILK